MNETDKHIAERFHAIFPNKEVADRLLDIVVTKRPLGVSRKSSYPYYKEYYAKWIKSWVDAMIETKQEIIFDYKIFCEDGDMSEQTLYNKVNQSIRFLVDFLDTEEKTYYHWRDVVDITRDRQKGGVIIKFIKELRASFEGQEPSPRLIVPREEGTPKWRQVMEDWLESDNARPFIQEGLALTPEEVKELKVSFAGLKGIQAVVNAISVKIIRTNE